MEEISLHNNVTGIELVRYFMAENKLTQNEMSDIFGVQGICWHVSHANLIYLSCQRSGSKGVTIQSMI